MIRWILHYNHYNIWHSVLSQGFMVRMIFYLCDFLDWKLPRKAEVSHMKASHEKENVIMKTSKEDSTTKVTGPSKDATPEVLEARWAARNDYGLAPLKDSDPSRSHPGIFQMVSDFNIREVEDLRDEYADLYQGRYRCSGWTWV